jgi:hypothetical protein
VPLVLLVVPSLGRLAVECFRRRGLRPGRPGYVEMPYDQLLEKLTGWREFAILRWARYYPIYFPFFGREESALPLVGTRVRWFWARLSYRNHLLASISDD